MPIIPDPIAEWLESFNGLEVILTAIAVFVLIRMIWGALKKWWPGLKRAITFFDSLFTLPEFIEESRKENAAQNSLLEEIRHEVLPNNGGSLRDELTTVSLQVEKLQAHQDKDYARLNDLENTVSRRLENRSLTARSTGEISTVKEGDENDE